MSNSVLYTKDMQDWSSFLNAQNSGSEDATGVASEQQGGSLFDYDILRSLLEIEKDDEDDEANEGKMGGPIGASFGSARGTLGEQFLSSMSGGSHPVMSNTSAPFSTVPPSQKTDGRGEMAKPGNGAVPVGFAANGAPTAWVFPPSRNPNQSPAHQASPQSGAATAVPPPPAYDAAISTLAPSLSPKPSQQQNNLSNMFSTAAAKPQSFLPPQAPQHPSPLEQQQSGQGPTYIVLGDNFNPSQLQNLNGCRIIFPNGNTVNVGNSNNANAAASTVPPSFFANGAWQQQEPQQPQQVQVPQPQQPSSLPLSTPGSLTLQQQLQLLSLVNMGVQASNSNANPNAAVASGLLPGQGVPMGAGSPTAQAVMNMSPNPNPMGSTQSVAQTQSIIARLQEQLRQLQQQQGHQNEATSGPLGAPPQQALPFQPYQRGAYDMGTQPLHGVPKPQPRLSSNVSETNSNTVGVTSTGSRSPTHESPADVPTPPWLEADKKEEEKPKGKAIGWMQKGSKWVPIYA